MSHPRNLIVAEEDSQATFVEDYVSLDGGAASPTRSRSWSPATTPCFRTT